MTSIRRIMSSTTASPPAEFVTAPSGPGGVRASKSVSDSAHWARLSASETDELRRLLLGSGTGAQDKADIVDAFTWADHRIDEHFKGILLLPMVACSDDLVWEKLCQVQTPTPKP